MESWPINNTDPGMVLPHLDLEDPGRVGEEGLAVGQREGIGEIERF